MPRADRRLAIEAFIELAKARWLVKFRKYSKWSHRLGRATALKGDTKMPMPLASELEQKANDLGRIIRMVARNTPFKANCLPQAAAAQSMLKRRNITQGTVFIGGKKGTKDDPLDLHAWLYVGSICVTGNDGPGDLKSFKPLIRYDLTTVQS